MYHKHHIHFVGIGGIGMSGIAEVLLNLGYPVSGSDLKSSPITRRLKKKGATIRYGHRSSNVESADVIVASSAITDKNPELKKAHRLNIPVIQRAEMLAELMRFSRYGIAVSGSHGKTTTTSLIATSLYQAGLDPTMIIGGRVNGFRSNARLGGGDFMVAEADESDGSFLKLSPSIAVITSIDPEHMDYYQNFDAVKQAFVDFTNKLPFYGSVIACVDHPVVCDILPQIKKKIISYGLSRKAYVRASHIRSQGIITRFKLSIDSQDKGEVILNLPGKHNVLNCLAALAVSHEIGLSFKKVKKALQNFKGIQRRAQVLLTKPEVTVIDDYGHHPEEIKATLETMKQAFKGRLITIFQPHRYSRTQDLFDDFVNAFDQTDELIITDIYPASEKPIRGVSARKLIKEIKKQKTIATHYVGDKTKIAETVLDMQKPGDVILTLGAGDITRIGKEIAKKLK